MAECGFRHTNLHKILLYNFILRLCDVLAVYKVKHLLSYALFLMHFSHTNVHGLATPLAQGLCYDLISVAS